VKDLPTDARGEGHGAAYCTAVASLAADFTLPHHEGSTITLSHYRDNSTVVLLLSTVKFSALMTSGQACWLR
jgi:peroxiredoxin